MKKTKTTQWVKARIERKHHVYWSKHRVLIFTAFYRIMASTVFMCSPCCIQYPDKIREAQMRMSHAVLMWRDT